MQKLSMKKITKNNREDLQLIVDDVLANLSGNEDIKTIKGIGSFFIDKKKEPHDVDLLIELNKSFENSNTKQLSDIIESLKDKYRNEKGETLLNIFIRDDIGKILDSVDLWFYYNKGEEFPFESRLSEAKPYFEEWKEAPILQNFSESLNFKKFSQNNMVDKIKEAWILNEEGKNSGEPFFNYGGRTDEVWVYHASEDAQKILQEGFKYGTKISRSGEVNDGMSNPDFIHGYLSNQNPQWGSGEGVTVKVKDAYLVWNNFDDGEQVLFEPKDVIEMKYVESFEDFCQIGKESINLSFKKFSQISKEDIQKAQAGDQEAIVKIIEENIGLITAPLIKWGYEPGTPEFEDMLSDIKVKMIEEIIPKYDSSKGAFSTYLTTSIYNFLKNLPRGKAYKAEEKEISLKEPVGEDITIQDTLEDPKSFLSELTLKGIKESFQNWLHGEKPELEDIILRIYDLKIENYSHEKIAEILNEEKITKKGRPITKKMVSDYVDLYMKPFLKEYFEAFKTASLNLKKKAQNKLTIQDLFRFYKMEQKGLLTDSFVNNFISKFIYGMQEYVEWVKNKEYKKDPELKYISIEYWSDETEDVLQDINTLESAYMLPLNEKIIAVDQLINAWHKAGMSTFVEGGDEEEVTNALNELFSGPRRHIKRLSFKKESSKCI